MAESTSFETFGTCNLYLQHVKNYPSFLFSQAFLNGVFDKLLTWINNQILWLSLTILSKDSWFMWKEDLTFCGMRNTFSIHDSEYPLTNSKQIKIWWESYIVLMGTYFLQHEMIDLRWFCNTFLLQLEIPYLQIFQKLVLRF